MKDQRSSAPLRQDRLTSPDTQRILSRYALTADQRIIIDISVSRIEDLFNNYDRIAPFPLKDLNQDFADYLIDSVREIGQRGFEIHIACGKMPDDSNKARVRMSISNYFAYLQALEVRLMREMFRKSAIFFGIGLAVLALSVALHRSLSADTTIVEQVVAEGLTIAAWVSLWESLAVLLVDWSPHRQSIRLFQHIAEAPVTFQPLETPAALEQTAPASSPS